MLLVNEQVRREIQLSQNKASVLAFIGLIDIVSFSLYYSIAMANTKNIRWHVAFLIASTLVALNPGLSRLLNQFQYGLGMITAILLPFIVSIGVIVFEKVKNKESVLKSPYFLYACLWTITIILFVTIPNTDFWTNFVSNNFK